MIVSRAFVQGLRCSTRCDEDCDAPCHEAHQVPVKRRHLVETCHGTLKAAADELARMGQEDGL